MNSGTLPGHPHQLPLSLPHRYTPRDPLMNSETYHYKRGANQQFSQVCHVFDPSLYPEEDLVYSFDREVLPLVIYCVAEEGDGEFEEDGG